MTGTLRFSRACSALARPLAIVLCCLHWVGCDGGREQTVASHPDPDAARPNVLLIVVDTLRADHLSHYGYDRGTAVALDDFRTRSTLFSRAYATAPWTGPSTISIHTGLSPARHGANAHGDVLPEEATTIAEYLSEAGYSTHGISYNYEVSAKTGYDQGFDRFVDYGNDVLDYPDIGFMVQRVERWIESEPKEPYFLYLQPMNTHGPYRVPEERQDALLGRRPSRAFEYYGEVMSSILREGDLARRGEVTPELIESLVDQYDVAVHYSMEGVAAILRALESSGLLENTLVVLTSDHGEELFDHGGFSHGYSLYREVLHVPLYLKTPGSAAGGGSSDRLVSTLDILPTILEWADLESDRELDGRSLTIEPRMLAGERSLVQRAGWTQRALGWSLIRENSHLIELQQAYDSPDPRSELYDLSTDPGETKDLAAREPRRVVHMRASLDERVATLGRARLEDGGNVLSEMDEARLRALGYAE